MVENDQILEDSQQTSTCIDALLITLSWLHMGMQKAQLTFKKLRAQNDNNKQKGQKDKTATSNR